MIQRPYSNNRCYVYCKTGFGGPFDYFTKAEDFTNDISIKKFDTRYEVGSSSFASGTVRRMDT